MTRHHCALIVATLTPLLLAGCGSSSPSKAAGSSPSAGGATTAPGASSPSRSAGPSQLSGSITVFAAASLTGTFTTLGKQFEAAHPGTTVTFDFGPSSTLAQQITSRAPADVFASASSKNMQTVVAAGDAKDPKVFVKNIAEIAVARESTSKVHALSDLAGPGVKVALCQQQVPCGVLAQKVLDKAKVTVKPVTRALDVKAVLATVSSGEVDAGIVYVTDVRAAKGKVAGVMISQADNASTAYPIATVTAGKNTALAQAFQDFVLSSDGQQVLTQAGFARP